MVTKAVGEVYPEPDARLRNIHAFQMSENYVIVPETSYLYDPCTKVFWNISEAVWLQSYQFEDSFDSVIQVVYFKGGV